MHRIEVALNPTLPTRPGVLAMICPISNPATVLCLISCALSIRPDQAQQWLFPQGVDRAGWCGADRQTRSLDFMSYTRVRVCPPSPAECQTLQLFITWFVIFSEHALPFLKLVYRAILNFRSFLRDNSCNIWYSFLNVQVFSLVWESVSSSPWGLPQDIQLCF